MAANRVKPSKIAWIFAVFQAITTLARRLRVGERLHFILAIGQSPFAAASHHLLEYLLHRRSGSDQIALLDGGVDKSFACGAASPMALLGATQWVGGVRK